MPKSVEFRGKSETHTSNCTFNHSEDSRLWETDFVFQSHYPSSLKDNQNNALNMELNRGIVLYSNCTIIWTQFIQALNTRGQFNKILIMWQLFMYLKQVLTLIGVVSPPLSPLFFSFSFQTQEHTVTLSDFGLDKAVLEAVFPVIHITLYGVTLHAVQHKFLNWTNFLQKSRKLLITCSAGKNLSLQFFLHLWHR